MYTLYSNPYSQHVRRVISLLEAAGLEYKLEPIDLGSGQHFSPEYLAINPNHQLPTLVSDTVTLHESNAIMRYLCNKHELNEWYPINPDQRGIVDQWLDWTQCMMSPAVVNIVLNKVFMGDKADLNAIEQGQESMTELAPMLDDALSKTLYIAGDHATIADLALVSNIFQLGLANELPQSPNIQRWYDKMLSLPAVQKSLPEQ